MLSFGCGCAITLGAALDGGVGECAAPGGPGLGVFQRTSADREGDDTLMTVANGEL